MATVWPGSSSGPMVSTAWVDLVALQQGARAEGRRCFPNCRARLACRKEIISTIVRETLTLTQNTLFPSGPQRFHSQHHGSPNLPQHICIVQPGRKYARRSKFYPTEKSASVTAGSSGRRGQSWVVEQGSRGIPSGIVDGSSRSRADDESLAEYKPAPPHVAGSDVCAGLTETSDGRPRQDV